MHLIKFAFDCAHDKLLYLWIACKCYVPCYNAITNSTKYLQFCMCIQMLNIQMHLCLLTNLCH